MNDKRARIAFRREMCGTRNVIGTDMQRPVPLLPANASRRAPSTRGTSRSRVPVSRAIPPMRLPALPSGPWTARDLGTASRCARTRRERAGSTPQGDPRGSARPAQYGSRLWTTPRPAWRVSLIASSSNAAPNLPQKSLPGERPGRNRSSMAATSSAPIPLSRLAESPTGVVFVGHTPRQAVLGPVRSGSLPCRNAPHPRYEAMRNVCSRGRIGTIPCVSGALEWSQGRTGIADGDSVAVTITGSAVESIPMDSIVSLKACQPPGKRLAA